MMIAVEYSLSHHVFVEDLEISQKKYAKPEKI